MTFRRDILVMALNYFFAEALSLGFTSFIVYIIKWIKDPDAEIQQGITYVIIQALMMSLFLLFRNHFFF